MLTRIMGLKNSATIPRVFVANGLQRLSGPQMVDGRDIHYRGLSPVATSIIRIQLHNRIKEGINKTISDDLSRLNTTGDCIITIDD